MEKQPIYKVIEQDLREKIKNGDYVEGMIIPKEIELTQIYDASRPTVAKAIQQLVKEGLLERKQRLGTVVCEKKISQQFTQTIESFHDEMIRKGLIPSTKVLSFNVVEASEEVAQAMNIEVGKHVYKLVRLRYGDDMPIVMLTTYLPYSIFNQFVAEDFVEESLYGILNKLGHPIYKLNRRLDVTLSDETTSDLLTINPGSPLFYFHSYGSTREGIVVEYSISKYRSDVNSFTFELINVVK